MLIRWYWISSSLIILTSLTEIIEEGQPTQPILFSAFLPLRSQKLTLQSSEMLAHTFLWRWIDETNRKETNPPLLDYIPAGRVRLVFVHCIIGAFAQALKCQKVFLWLSSDSRRLTVTICQAAVVILGSKLLNSKASLSPPPSPPRLSHASETLLLQNLLCRSVSSAVFIGCLWVSGFNRWNHARIMSFTWIFPGMPFPEEICTGCTKLLVSPSRALCGDSEPHIH